MNLSQLQDDEKLFLARIDDLFTLSAGKSRTVFSKFLNGREIMIADEFIRQNRLDGFLFYGGRENAERLMLGVFAPHCEPDPEHFPIVRVTAKYPENAHLTHRDFLGTLTSLQITRESVGDILVSGGRCDFFVTDAVSNIILTEVTKVGGFGVKIATGVPGDFVVSDKFEDIRVTISSIRIDSLVSRLTGMSREKAAEFIKRGLVQKSFAVADNGSKPFSAGDTLSMRGYGKYIVDEIGIPTKKGKLPVICRKYI